MSRKTTVMVLESMCNESGDVVIVTGDNQGSFVRYTFTE